MKLTGTVHRIIPTDPYDIAGTESWLEDLAGEGLFFQHCGTFSVRFSRGAPRRRRYRLDPSAGRPDRERAEYYVACGWRAASRINQVFQVYYTDDPGAPEVHTDPVAQSYTLDALDRRLRFFTLVFCLLVAAIFAVQGVFLLGTSWPVLTLIDGTSAASPLLLSVELVLLILFFWQVRGLRRLKRQLRAGLPIEHPRDYRRSGRIWYAFQIAAILLALSGLVLNLVSLNAHWRRPLEEVADAVPLVSLAELEGAEDYVPTVVTGTRLNLDNLACYDWSYLSAHYEIRQSGHIPSRLDGEEVYDCRLNMDYYDISLPFLAGAALDELVYRYTQHYYFPEEYTVAERAYPGLDRAVVAVDNDWPGLRVFASRGGRVVYLDYSGTLEADRLLSAAAELLNG